MRVTALASAACLLLPAVAIADGMEPPKLVAAPNLPVHALRLGAVGQRRRRRPGPQLRGRGDAELEDLNFAWMSYQQAKNGPLTLFTDVIYASVASGGSFATSKTFSPHVAGTIGAALSADYKYWIIEAGGTYEIASWISHGGRYATPDTQLELLAGGRYWHQELDIAVALAGTANVDGLIVSGDRAFAHSGAQEWVDPFVGARIRFQPARGEEIVVRGDVGGFGVGSKFTWQALATYNWQVCTQGPMLIDGYAGWRALQVDYATGAGVERYEFDVLQQGPVMGFTGRF